VSDEKYVVPKRTGGDTAHVGAKAGLSAIPVVGGPAAELLQFLLQSPIEKRRDQWMLEVAEGLRTLEAEGLRLEDLQSNDEFVSIVLQATHIALRTHQAQKRDALRNAVLNVANGSSVEDALQSLFLNLVDSFTEWHLRILKLFHAPPVVPGLTMGGGANVLEYAIPELKGRRNYYDPIWRDLYLRGLVGSDSLHLTASAVTLSQKATTELGDKFLFFISAPSGIAL